MKVISLASMNVSIVNDNYDELISFGGGGKQIGSASYSFTNDMFRMNTSADGGYSVSHNASKSGTVSIDIQQTSPVVDTLCKYILWCRDNPELASATITISDSTGIINVTGVDCVPTSYPGNSVGESAATRNFSFAVGVLTPQEYMVEEYR